LRKVTFGELTDVKGDYENGTGIFGNDPFLTQNIDLELSERQRIMTKELIVGRYCWTPTDEPYMGGPDYTNKSFLGMTFKSVKCGD
jgi:hypothetical protein